MKALVTALIVPILAASSLAPAAPAKLALSVPTAKKVAKLSSYTSGGGFTFAVVTVKVTNNSTGSVKLDEHAFTLDTDATANLSLNGGGSALDLAANAFNSHPATRTLENRCSSAINLARGKSATCSLAFEVPASSKMVRVSFNGASATFTF